MKFHGNVDLQQNELRNVTLQHTQNFPETPKVGSFIFKEKRVMICIENTGLPVWVPLTHQINTVLHQQDVASVSWVIPHNLNSSSVIVQAFDQDNKVIIPDEIDCSVHNETVVTFHTAVAGRAILMLGESHGTPRPTIAYENSYTSSTEWVVNHMLGYEPIIRVFIGNQEVQPASIVHTDTNSATITFSSAQSGSVRCI